LQKDMNMTPQSKHNPSNPPSLWEMDPQSFASAETAIRTWFEYSGRAQERATKFLNHRWAKDAAALAQLGQCRTPVEAVNAQMTYLTGAYADYLSEGQKLVGILSDFARETMPGMFVDRTSAKPKHAPRRVASH
jgi:hypothetical protein